MLVYTSCWLVSSDFIPRVLQDLERSSFRSAQFRLQSWMGSSGIIPVESFTRSTWKISPHKFLLQYWMGSSGFIPRECTRTTNISVCTSSGSYHHSRGPILLLVAFVWVCRSTDRNTILLKCWARRREFKSSSCSLYLYLVLSPWCFLSFFSPSFGPKHMRSQQAAVLSHATAVTSSLLPPPDNIWTM